METIFVQIASYRDAELPRTISSALENAQHGNRLRFGICWQYDESTYTDLDPFLLDPRFRVTQVHYEQSHGCCWARHQTNRLHDGEDYTLQIDAHTRFAPDWDSRFIEMLAAIPAAKPLLTTYPSPFERRHGIDVLHSHGMQRLILNRMARDLTTIYKSEYVDDTSKPAPSQFIAAGQIFTRGSFCREVEYDPRMYYAGEEISLAARAYTHGYDFFCPNQDLVWHLYQHAMPTHWSDHQRTRHEGAIERLKILLTGDHQSLGRHGLGEARSLGDFETYAGLDFKARLNAPGKQVHFKRAIRFDPGSLENRPDYHLWIFTLTNAEGDEIYRLDIHDPDVLNMKRCEIEIDAVLEDDPVSYMLWPKTWRDGFLERQFFPL